MGPSHFSKYVVDNNKIQLASNMKVILSCFSNLMNLISHGIMMLIILLSFSWNKYYFRFSFATFSIILPKLETENKKGN